MTPKKVSQKRKRRTTFVVDATCTSDGERYTVSEMSGTSEWITVSLQFAPTQPRRRIGFDTSGKTASRKGRKVVTPDERALALRLADRPTD